tara:strand:- start:227 stop:445 length:219 start_codon:yes stop_codon:yes gene_type:complete
MKTFVLMCSSKKSLLEQLPNSQVQFMKKFIWRVEYDFNSNQHKLTIRSSNFSNKDYSRMLFLFPYAYAEDEF